MNSLTVCSVQFLPCQQVPKKYLASPPPRIYVLPSTVVIPVIGLIRSLRKEDVSKKETMLITNQGSNSLLKSRCTDQLGAITSVLCRVQ